jgi:hypothetical protein
MIVFVKITRNSFGINDLYENRWTGLKKDKSSRRASQALITLINLTYYYCNKDKALSHWFSTFETDLQKRTIKGFKEWIKRMYNAYVK